MQTGPKVAFSVSSLLLCRLGQVEFEVEKKIACKAFAKRFYVTR